MDAALREEIEQAAERHALINAVKHEGAANPGAIMGPLMADHPEFREHADEIMGVIAPIVERVNGLSAGERRERLGTVAPAVLDDLEAEPEQGEEPPLPALPQVDDHDEIRLRCAPNPNGPWHIGNARMGAVIGTYADQYDGWMLCRFDDTDPDTKRPDLAAYGEILEDLRYLGFEPDEVIRASDRLDLYYARARELIEAGGAYTCSCPQATFSDLKAEAQACPHRDKDPAVSREEFEAMVAGEYGEGDMVLRVRTDIEAPNPAERDWVAFRIVERPHPREVAADYRCWPMLDFQSAIDDHETAITHIIRGKDLQDSAARQGHLYEYLGWTYPEVLHWGRISVDAYDLPLSTSRIAELIEAGELDGWDDPRAPTLRSLARRGIRGAAVTSALGELGVSTSDVELSMSSIYAENRERIDPDTDRYFLVRDGRRLPLAGEVPDRAHPPRHPDDESRGRRSLAVGDAVLMESEDIPAREERVWLKGLGCLRHSRDALAWVGDDISAVRDEGVPVVHWVPAEDGIDVTVRGPDGAFSGVAEAGLRDAPVDAVVQFERVAFVRIDEHRREHTVAYFTHP